MMNKIPGEGGLGSRFSVEANDELYRALDSIIQRQPLERQSNSNRRRDYNLNSRVGRYFGSSREPQLTQLRRQVSVSELLS
jgi:hypothetical protein